MFVSVSVRVTCYFQHVVNRFEVVIVSRKDGDFEHNTSI